ncbi:hypothetical protein [Marinicella rhabdoformis]|uniref:hypothetical protein n=1 Tax=Marinicella rhabdoformis TaxID=2580566 RepID=UPI0012AEC4DE|nr:hypothetical protein [Marinicella rhabdoformis]
MYNKPDKENPMNTSKNPIEPKKFRFNNKFKFYAISSMMLVQLIVFMGKASGLNVYLKILIALVPAIPFVLALYSLASMIKNDDELSTKIITDALSLTFCITITWALIAGLLQFMNVLPTYNFIVVFALIVGTFSISFLIISQKYK